MDLPKNSADLEHVINHAITNLFGCPPTMFEFTAQTVQTEWNLGHHLAMELAKLLPSLEYDLDLAKKSYGNRRPDIVFHKRGTHRSNYLVLEIKRDGSPRKVQEDIRKIKRYWFKKPLEYKFGAAVNLRKSGKHDVQIFRNPARSRNSRKA